mgnify:FL=1
MGRRSPSTEVGIKRLDRTLKDELGGEPKSRGGQSDGICMLHYHFLTGQLAAPALQRVVERLAAAAGFRYSIQVLPITVAAMIAPKWAARRIQVPGEATAVIVPGWCLGDLVPLEQAAGVPIRRGPKDLEDLPEFFQQGPPKDGYGEYDLEILVQLRDAGRMALGDLLSKAKRLDSCGADMILLGDGGMEAWPDVAEQVAALRDEGRRTGIAHRDPATVEAAIEAGVELVLPVDGSNRRLAAGWGCELVLVSDTPGTLDGLEETVGELTAAGARFRIDPGLNPIAFGFAESLGRHLAVRWRWPDAELVMRTATVTEQTEVDSAPVHVLLLGFCQEMGIRSILTSQENNWTRSAVRECDLARQLTYHAVKHALLPKQLEPGLAILRDTKLVDRPLEEILELGSALKDSSYRFFAQQGRLHAVAAGFYADGTDPYDLLEQILQRGQRPLDPRYAFYMGYELCKAVTALTLGKNYYQDSALDWGAFTVRELTRRERRARRVAREAQDSRTDSRAGSSGPAPGDSLPTTRATRPTADGGGTDAEPPPNSSSESL